MAESTVSLWQEQSGEKLRIKRTIEITVEREEVFRIRKPINQTAVWRTAVWCAECGAHVPMLGIEEAMAVLGISLQELVRRAVSRDVHSTESPDGELLVCINSF